MAAARSNLLDSDMLRRAALRLAPLGVLLLANCERRHPVGRAPGYRFPTAVDRAAGRLVRTSAPTRYPTGAALEVWRLGGGRYAGDRDRVWVLVAPAGRVLPDTVILGHAPAGFAVTGNASALRLPGRYEVRLQPDAGTFAPLPMEVGPDGTIVPEAAT